MSPGEQRLVQDVRSRLQVIINSTLNQCTKFTSVSNNEILPDSLHTFDLSQISTTRSLKARFYYKV